MSLFYFAKDIIPYRPIRHRKRTAIWQSLFLYIENPWLDQGLDKALAMSL